MDADRKIQIGILPPPLGGVSVYLYRLRKIRPQDTFLDRRTLSFGNIVALALQGKNEIIVHGTGWKLLFLFHMTQWLRRSPYSVVLHGQGWMQDFDGQSGWRKQMMKAALRHCKSIQVVGEHIREALLARMPDIGDKVFVKNAFLPPPLEDEAKILKTYERDMMEFVETHHPLMVANAFQLAVWNDGTDLYGLDMCVELLRRLKADYPGIGMVFALANDRFNAGYYAEMKCRIREQSLEEHIYFMTGQKELWPLFRCGQLMLRPTCTDGFSVSIQEAIVLGCRTVASNVCNRPAGTVTFRNRDMQDFEDKVRGVLRESMATGM